MRTFLGTHWKAIAALIVLVLLALFAVPTGTASPALATRLQARTEALAHHSSDATGYIAATLVAQGYRVRLQRDGPGGTAARTIEAWHTNARRGQQPQRSFIVMARLRPHGDELPATAAMLELARLLKDLRPAAGTEIRFVFLVSRAPLPDAMSGSFVAYAGPRAALAEVGASLAFFRSPPDGPAGVIAAPGWVQGVTLGHLQAAGTGNRAMLLADIGALQSPCLPARNDGGRADFKAAARMLRQLALSVRTLAGAAQS